MREEEWPGEEAGRKGEVREATLGGEVERGKLHSSSTLWGRRQRMRGLGGAQRHEEVEKL